MKLINEDDRREKNLEAAIDALESDGFKMDDYLKSIFTEYFLGNISYEVFVTKKLKYGKKQGFIDSSDEEIEAFVKLITKKRYPEY